MSKELDEFEEMYNWIYCNCGTTYEDDVKLDRIRTNVKRALQRLEAIDKKRCGANVEKIIIDEFVPSNELDNAKPSEALEDSLKLYKMVESAGNGNGFNLNEAWEYHKTIKQALLKAQEQEKVLEILKNKKVDIWKFIDNGIFNYSYDDYYFCWNYYSCEKLTQEEFDLLKRWYNE